MICCQTLQEKGFQISPFKRMLATKYYDGATEGVIVCETCEKAYAFKMLDWDESQNVRIFAMFHLPSKWNDIVKQVSSHKNPLDKFILVSSLTDIEIKIIETQFFNQVTQICASCNLQKEILFWYQFKGLSEKINIDWFEKFGLNRQGYGSQSL